VDQERSGCAAYWNRHEKNKTDDPGHWILPADKFHQDGDGYYWFDGRTDECSSQRRMGKPFEIESVLIEHAAVTEAAVVATKDKDGLTRPIAWWCSRQDSSAMQTCFEPPGICCFASSNYKRPAVWSCF